MKRTWKGWMCPCGKVFIPLEDDSYEAEKCCGDLPIKVKITEVRWKIK